MSQRILGLDLGAKSCGIAWSDTLKLVAHGQENYFFPNQDWLALFKHLAANYLSHVSKIVLGYPLLPSGDKSQTTLMIESFQTFLAKRTSLPIILEPEFGTTKAAHEVMIAAGLTRKKRKSQKDKLAAVLILQAYLDRIEHE